MKKDRWVDKLPIGSIVVGILTLFIGGVFSWLGSWDFYNDEFIIIKIFILIVLFIGYLIAVVHFGKQDINLKKVNTLYRRQNEAFEELIAGIMAVCSDSAKGANELTYGIIKEGKVHLDVWNFDLACTVICKNVYDLLCRLGSGRDFEVIYDKLIEEETEKHIINNAYANEKGIQPTIFQVKRRISDDDYHDCELFLGNEEDVEVVLGYEKIDEIFGHRSKAKRNKNKKKYSQYVSIPVMNMSQDGKKEMVGLFEIVCLRKSSLGESEEEIKELAGRYLVPYTYMILVFSRLERALIAKPEGDSF